MPNDRPLLADDEEVLVDTRLHWVSLVGPAALTVAAVAGALAIGVSFPGAPVAVGWVLAAMVALPALWLVGRVLRWRGVRLLVTTGRLVYRRGVLGRDVAQLRLQRVAEVHCTQTLRGRLIGCGRLVLEVDGGAAMVVDGVRRPRSLQRLIASQLDQLWHGGYADGWSGPAEPSRWRAAPPHSAPPASVPVAPMAVPGPFSMSDTPPGGVHVPPGARTTVLPTVPAVPTAGPTGRWPTAASQPPAGGAASVPEQLIALDDLRKRGILTAEEFHAKKAELLRRL